MTYTLPKFEFKEAAKICTDEYEGIGREAIENEDCNSNKSFRHMGGITETILKTMHDTRLFNSQQDVSISV